MEVNRPRALLRDALGAMPTPAPIRINLIQTTNAGVGMLR